MEAIKLTHDLFPGILEKNPTLLFALKIRQFIEMINDTNKKSKKPNDEQNQIDVKCTNTSEEVYHIRSATSNQHLNGNANNDMDIDTNNITSSITTSSISTLTDQSNSDAKNSINNSNSLSTIASQNGNNGFYSNSNNSENDMMGNFVYLLKTLFIFNFFF